MSGREVWERHETTHRLHNQGTPQSLLHGCAELGDRLRAPWGGIEG